MTALLVISAVAASVSLLFSASRPPATARELTAIGWSPTAVTAAAWAATTMTALSVLVTASMIVDARTGVAAATVTATWLPQVMPRLLRAALLGIYRTRRDTAMVAWLRRIRLYAASGSPLSEAAVWAAARVADPGFAPTATAVNHALADGRDPLAAAADHLAGTPAETLVATVVVADRTGAAAVDLIDGLVGRAVAALEDARRLRIDRLGRSVVTSATVVVIMTVVLVMAAVSSSLPTGL